MASSSASSSASRQQADIPPITRNMAFPKSDIRVNLRDHFNSKVYTSSSPVTGDVTITTKRDVRFDSIQIVLVGSSHASFEGMGFPQEITHTFLKMSMPIPESLYPVPRVLETGRTLTIPFNFVIPNQLTINACNHPRLMDQLQDHHLVPPPSLGGWQKDDMAPKMTRVSYTIKARVLRDGEANNKKVRIMEATQAIQVLPATPEEPPLSVSDKDSLYHMTKSKTMRKVISKAGRLTVQAVQPGAAVLRPDGLGLAKTPTASFNLTFEPDAPGTQPPSITKVKGILKSHTFYSSGTISSFPNLGEWIGPLVTDKRSQYFYQVPLPPVTVANQPVWTQRPTSAAARRDSGYSSEGVDSSSPLEAFSRNRPAEKPSKSPVLHTSTFSVALPMPLDKKMVVPTFHSCIVSRVYSVDLSISFEAKSSSTTLKLTVPLQVAVEAPSQPGEGSGEPPSFEELAADEHLQPRILMAPPEVDSERMGVLPGYGEAVEGSRASRRMVANEATS